MTTDWPAHEDAAAALRRLNRAFSTFEVGADELRDLTRRADDLAGRLEGGRRRHKEEDAAAFNGDSTTIAIGAAVEFDPFSACGGRLHPSSVGLAIERDGDASVLATVTVDPMFQGPPGRVHGGIVALIVDEVTACVNRVAGHRAFTARLTVNLRAPAPTGTELTFRAWLRERAGRKIIVDAEGRTNAGIFVDGEALFVMTDGS